MKLIEKAKGFIERHPVITTTTAAVIGIVGGYCLNNKIHMKERNSWYKFMDDASESGFDLSRAGVFGTFETTVDESWKDSDVPEKLNAKEGDTLNVLEIIYKKD